MYIFVIRNSYYTPNFCRSNSTRLMIAIDSIKFMTNHLTSHRINEIRISYFGSINRAE